MTFTADGYNLITLSYMVYHIIWYQKKVMDFLLVTKKLIKKKNTKKNEKQKKIIHKTKNKNKI